MKIATEGVKALCPTCRDEVQLPEGYKLWQIVFCKACDSELEIVAVNPPILDWRYVEDHVPWRW